MVYKDITYDDRDTTNIHYNEYWFITGSYNASSVGETGTLSSSLSPDAALTFTFPGEYCKCPFTYACVSYT